MMMKCRRELLRDAARRLYASFQRMVERAHISHRSIRKPRAGMPKRDSSYFFAAREDATACRWFPSEAPSGHRSSRIPF